MNHESWNQAMLKQHSFSNPFSSIKDKFQKSGRSNSAPGAYDIYIDSRKLGCHSPRLPSVSEGSTEELNAGSGSDCSIREGASGSPEWGPSSPPLAPPLLGAPTFCDFCRARHLLQFWPMLRTFCRIGQMCSRVPACRLVQLLALPRPSFLCTNSAISDLAMACSPVLSSPALSSSVLTSSEHGKLCAVAQRFSVFYSVFWGESPSSDKLNSSFRPNSPPTSWTYKLTSWIILIAPSTFDESESFQPARTLGQHRLCLWIRTSASGSNSSQTGKFTFFFFFQWNSKLKSNRK